MTLFFGLDFGTSNSTFSVASQHGGAHLLPLEGEDLTLPSAIFFSFEDASVSYGRKALSEYVSGADGRLLRSLKSVLGTSLVNDATRIKARVVPFIDIVSQFVGEVKRRAEARLDQPIETVMVGRPVHFVDGDPVADREAQDQLEGAVRAQGFKHIAFQFEPIAAALDYEQQAEREKLVLIVDLGGGTSDFSVVRVSPDRAKAVERDSDILSTAGVHVGGTDFDRLLSMQAVMPRLGMGSETLDGKRYLPVAPYYDLSTWHRINRLYAQKELLGLRQTRQEAARPDLVARMLAVVEQRQGHNLLGAVEAAKIALSDADVFQFAFDAGGADIAAPMSRAEFLGAIEASLDRIASSAREALMRAGVDGVDSVILTGGSTKVPAVTALLTGMFPEAEFVRTDAFGSVGMGLALDAVRRFRQR